jgi:hypothetical protein
MQAKVLAFAISYFSESGLFNGLRPIQKNSSPFRPRQNAASRSQISVIRHAALKGANAIRRLINI